MLTTEPKAMMSFSYEISSPESVVMLLFLMLVFVTFVLVLKSMPAATDSGNESMSLFHYFAQSVEISNPDIVRWYNNAVVSYHTTSNNCNGRLNTQMTFCIEAHHFPCTRQAHASRRHRPLLCGSQAAVQALQVISVNRMAYVVTFGIAFVRLS